MRELASYRGIDKIYEFLVCIRLEQRFLRVFPEDYVKGVLRQYYGKETDMVDNICEILLLTISRYILIGKSLVEKLQETDYQKLQCYLQKMDMEEVADRLKESVGKLVERCGEDSGELLEYLTGTFNSVAVRLKNTSVYGEL